MAGNLLMSISKDERERAVFRSRRMFQTDRESDMATAEDRGIQKGKIEGKVEIARNLLKMNMPIDQIVTATNLTVDEVEGLRNMN